MLGNSDLSRLRHDSAKGDFFLHLGDSRVLHSIASAFQRLGAKVEVDREVNRLVIHRPEFKSQD